MSRFPTRVLVLLLALLAWPRLGTSATYYVADSGGVDARSCDTAQTLGTPRKTINAGLACLSGAGDTLYIRGGTYDEYILQTSYPSGASWSNPTPGGSVVWIGAYYDGSNYENVTIQHSYSGNVLTMTRSNYVIWDHLHIHQTDSNRSVIGAGEAAQRFQYGEVTASSSPGCVIPSGGADGILVVIFERNPSAPGNGIEFLYNNIHHSPCAYSFYIQGQSSNVLIEGNSLHDNNWMGIQAYVSPCYGPNPNAGCFYNLVIRNNLIYNNGHGFNPQTGSSVNQGCGVLLASCNSCQIYNNVFYDNYCGIEFRGHGLNNAVYNNTFYNNQDDRANFATIILEDGIVDTTVTNNISYLSGNALVGPRPGTPQVGTFTATNNSLGINPQFADVSGSTRDLHLTASTPTSIRDAGVCLAAVPTDRDGNARPAGATCDIGAYKYGATIITPLPAPTNLQVIRVE